MRFKELDAYLYFYSAYIEISILIKKNIQNISYANYFLLI